MVKVAINGFGRIGRNALKILLSSNEKIANRTREVFPVFLDFVQYYREQKEKGRGGDPVPCAAA